MDREPIKRAYLSQTGRTYSIDYMMCNINYVGKGLAAETLSSFIEYFRKEIDNHADVFLLIQILTTQRLFIYIKKQDLNMLGILPWKKGCLLDLKPTS